MPRRDVNIPQGIIDRFERQIERVPPSDCWLFSGMDVNQHGHPRFWIGLLEQKRNGAHRFSYELYVGPVGNSFVLHKCDVPCCVNPDHLFLGTQADNMADKARKGRAADRRGEKHPLSKITNAQTSELIAAYKAGTRQCVLARQYGLAASTVCQIIKGQRRGAAQ